MSKAIRIVIIVVVCALLIWPLIVIGDWLTVRSVREHFFDALAAKVGWNTYLIRVLILVGVFPFIYGVKLFFTPFNQHKRKVGALLMTLMAILYNLTLYYGTKDAMFAMRRGEPPLKYYAITEHGVVFYDRPGVDTATGQELKPVTPGVIHELNHLREGSLEKVDPTNMVWFNPYDGQPMLWYYRFPDGQLEFFNRPGRHPLTGDPLSPVTKELFLSWRADNQTNAARASGSSGAAGGRGAVGKGAAETAKVDVRMAGFRAALIAGAGRGTAGVLTLGQDELGLEGADALARHLHGFNGNALRADVLRREGFGAELYAGDAALLNEAMTVTGLGSLVVAQVTVQCDKRSQLDSDLLSCDLVVSAHRFDAHGNPAGSASARGTGAGFSRADALEQAAERASGSLSGLAAR